MPTRREFLKTLTAVAVATSSGSVFSRAGFARSPGQPQWRLAPETGCFESQVGPGVIPHLEEANRRGFKVFLDPALLGRGLRERREILIAARELGLTLGPAELAFRHAGAGLASEYDAFLAACAAGLTGGRILVGPTVMLRPGDRDWHPSVKLARRLADARTVPLFLEAWDDGRRGAALYDDAAAWVAAVDHPQLRLRRNSVRRKTPLWPASAIVAHRTGFSRCSK
jgi:hypothetical protein